MAASVTLAAPVVGPAENRTVTITATVGAAADPTRPVHIHWTTIAAAIPAGYRGGRGASQLVFAPGTFDPGVYNVKCVVVDPSDGTSAEDDEAFTIPKLSAVVYTPPIVTVAP